MTDSVVLTDGESQITLHPPEYYSDGHGLHHRVDLVGGPFYGSIDAVSYEGRRGLQSFHRQLVALYENLSGEAALPESYENLKVSLTGNGRGHVTVRADARAYGPISDVRFSFSFQIDQTHLPSIIAAVERLFVTERL